MRTLISDPGDERLADYRHLTDPAARIRQEEEGGFFIVEGWEAVRRLLTTDWPVRSVLIAQDKVSKLKMPPAVPVLVAPPLVLEATVGFQLHRGVIAAVNRRAFPNLAEVAAAARTLVVLEGINDHENLGAIYRSAAALGGDGVILDPTCADPFYRRCVRVSMGTVLTTPTARANPWPEQIDSLRRHGFRVLAFTPRSEAADLNAVEVPARGALLFGSEAQGLSDSALEHADLIVKIPHRADVDSLNVGHAAAIALYRFGHV